jgi:hypothetical protein
MIAATRAGSRSALNSFSMPAIASLVKSRAGPIGKGTWKTSGIIDAEALLVGLDLAGQRHAHEGPAVEAAAKGDDGIAAGGDAGDLDRVLAGLGAGGDEDRLLLPNCPAPAFSRSARRM